MKYFHLGLRDLYISAYVDHVTRLGNFLCPRNIYIKQMFLKHRCFGTCDMYKMLCSSSVTYKRNVYNSVQFQCHRNTTNASMISTSALSSGLKGFQSLTAIGSADVLRMGSKNLLVGMMPFKSPNTTGMAAIFYLMLSIRLSAIHKVPTR